MIKNAMKLVKETEAGAFKNKAGNLNFYDNGNTMQWGFDSCAKLQLQPPQDKRITKAVILRMLNEKLENEIMHGE